MFCHNCGAKLPEFEGKLVCTCGTVHCTKPKSSGRRVVNTGGGAFVEGGVTTGGGDFVGGDKVVGDKVAGEGIPGDKVLGDRLSGSKVVIHVHDEDEE